MNFVELKSGQSVEGDEIRAYRSETKGSKYCYLISGIHGDEVEGVFVLSKLFDELKQNDDLDIPLIIIPVLNVDGHRNGIRVNAHGVDLNRNFNSSNWSQSSSAPRYFPGTSPQTEPEGLFLCQLFHKFHPHLVVSIHSWKPMVNYDGKGGLEFANILATYNGYDVKETVGYDTPGSLGAFVPEKYNCPVLTLECPTVESGASLQEIWNQNKEGLFQLLKTLS